MVRLCRVVAPLAAALVLAACGGSGDEPDDDAWFAAPVPSYTPVAVEGVAPCADIPQAAEPAGSPGRAAVGERLPALALPCLTPGPDIHLAAVGGRPLLVNLWASWCDPCLREMPLLQAAYAEHGDELDVLGVDTKDRADAAAAFLGTVDVGYPHVVDLDGALLRAVGVPGLPVTLALDAEGRVAARHVGELDEAGLDELLRAVDVGPAV